MKFGHLTLRKIYKFLATRCQILRLKCAKFNFGWGSAPDTGDGGLQRSPDLLAGFKGPASKGREGRSGEWESGNGRGKGSEWVGMEEEGTLRVGSHSNVRNPENTLIAELPGGKHRRAATVLAGRGECQFSEGGRVRKCALLTVIFCVHHLSLKVLISFYRASYASTV